MAQRLATNDGPSGPLDQRKLIRRAQRGDQAASRELVDLYKERLFGFVWRVVRNHHDAEEICQETFLRAFAALDSFNERYRFSTWLFTIAYRLSLNHLRRRSPVPGGDGLNDVPDNQPDATEIVAASEQAKRLEQLIWQSVDRLSPSQKATVMLFYHEQMSCQEISKVLDMPVATVKSHLHRARAKLREMLWHRLGDQRLQMRIVGAG
jgi:RNA polymerase sigma-70 factor (ECF subfamily)